MTEPTDDSANLFGRPLALWHVAPGRAALRAGAVGEGDALIRARWSLISRGTERLVHQGRVPATEWARMRAPHQEGEFPFPVKYGYAMVGEVVAGPAALIGRDVFALYPHQTHFRLPAAELIPLPAALPPRRATLAANMETALNALWDAGAGPGDRIAVIGAGLIGCLVARLARRIPGADVILMDRLTGRRDLAAQLNVNFTSDQIPGRAFDIAVHASASAEGLAAALGCLGPEGRLVELSWYGEGDVAVPLGGAFHSQRLQIISSQVGRVSPSRRPRWPARRRLEKALQLLDDPALDALIDTEAPFGELAARAPALLASDAGGVATVIRYE
ncbi:zinc-binding alcohol dehydrogenase [Pikeienuella sp. HZG-20]|uniref:zinc-dependent alcohol dehydrogenase n=1 Tax=Paludibacillus litoralis TaxID=3133267 RepID=UPI0030ED3603